MTGIVYFYVKIVFMIQKTKNKQTNKQKNVFVFWYRPGHIACTKPLQAGQIFRAHIFCLAPEKNENIRYVNFQSNRETNKTITINLKYCREHQRTNFTTYVWNKVFKNGPSKICGKT